MAGAIESIHVDKTSQACRAFPEKGQEGQGRHRTLLYREPEFCANLSVHTPVHDRLQSGKHWDKGFFP